MNVFDRLAALQQLGKYADALRLASEAKKDAKTELDLYVLLSVESGCASTLKQFSVARAALETTKNLSISKEPWAQFQIQVQEAQLLLDEGSPERALGMMEKLALTAESVVFDADLQFLKYEFYRTFGTVLYKNERFEEAIPHLMKSLHEDLPIEARSEVLSMLGDCLTLTSRLREAASCLSEVEQLGPPSSFEYRLNLDLGICRRGLGDLASAKTYFRIAQSLAQDEESRSVTHRLICELEKVAKANKTSGPT